jgi:hypothetical protein
MGAGNFDQPSSVTVASASDALSITNTGPGRALTAKSNSSDGVHGTTPDSNSAGVWGENGQNPDPTADNRFSAGSRGSNYSVGGGDLGVAGVFGEAITAVGVWGTSNQGTGVRGESASALGVLGRSGGADGVQGVTTSQAHAGVAAINDSGGPGLSARGTPAVLASSSGNDGVRGICTSKIHAGVGAINDSGGPGLSARGTPAILASSSGNDGVQGICTTSAHAGVAAINDSGGPGLAARGTPAVLASSSGNDGVQGICTTSAHAGVAAINDSGGPGISARGTPAGLFQGNVTITGTLTAYDVQLANSDCAEDFDVCGEEIESGTVMVLDKGGRLQPSNAPYDKKVAGVVSGARDYKPAIVLGRHDSRRQRLPIALVGKVYCRVDAGYAAVEVGDLLTTSPTRGHAMKADDPLKSFGAVIGKALRRLEKGQELIPILVALQ